MVIIEEKWKVEDIFTHEKLKELTMLYKEAMNPSQEEEDWMLMVEIEKGRKEIQKYKVEDICPVWTRIVFKKEIIESRIQKTHYEYDVVQSKQEDLKESWLSKTLPNMVLKDDFGGQICGMSWESHGLSCLSSEPTEEARKPQPWPAVFTFPSRGWVGLRQILFVQSWSTHPAVVDSMQLFNGSISCRLLHGNNFHFRWSAAK